MEGRIRPSVLRRLRQIITTHNLSFFIDIDSSFVIIISILGSNFMVLSEQVYDELVSTVEVQIAENRRVIRDITDDLEHIRKAATKKIDLLRFFDKYRALFPQETELSRMIIKADELLEYLKKESVKLGTVRSALSINGMSGATLSFPGLPLTIFGKSDDYLYVLLSGIKQNAKQKQETFQAIDFEEKILFELEKQIANYINVDYGIDLDSLDVVLDLLKKYLDTFYENLKKHINKSKDDSQEHLTRVDYILLRLMFYILKKEKGIDLSIEPISEITKKYIAGLSHGLTEGAAIKGVALSYISKYSKRVSYTVKRPKGKSVISPTVKVPYDPLSEYIRNGLVIKSCDIKTFEDLISASSLSDDKKIDLLDQMYSLIDEEQRLKEENFIERFRESVLTEEEMDLYNRAKQNSTTCRQVKDIDALLELMFETKDPNERNVLFEELKEAFSLLSNLLVSAKKTIPKQSSIQYFMVPDLASDGSIKMIPKFLSGIGSFSKEDYKPIYTCLEKVINGYTSQDQEIHAPLPFRVWYKQKGSVKVLYVKLKGLCVIIDVVECDIASPKVLNMLKDEELGRQLEDLKEKSKNGALSDSQESFDSIKNLLEKSHAVKSMIMKKRGI